MNAPETFDLASQQSEAFVTINVANFLGAQGYSIWLEVPNLGQSADLVAGLEEDLTFVEVKKKDWRRALRQCRAHHMVADYVCIAIAQTRLSETFLLEAKRLGYGVIHFDPKGHLCRWIERPTRLQEYWKPERTRLISRIKEIPRYA